MWGCNTVDHRKKIDQWERSLQTPFLPQEFVLVVTPWRRTVWDELSTKTNQGWNFCSVREATLVMGTDVGSLTAADR